MTQPADTGEVGAAPGFRPNKTRAGIAGASSGTGLVAVAQAVGPDRPVGIVLLYLAPTVSFIIGVLLYYVEDRVARFLERRQVKSAMKTLEQALDNPRTSETHKVKIRLMLEELEEFVVTGELRRIKQAALTQPDQATAEP